MDRIENVTIGMVGAGGDGIAIVGSLLQRLGALQGFYGQLQKSYGAQIRGGGSAVKLNFNSANPALPNDTLHILVALNWDKYAEFSEELTTDGRTVILCEQEPPLERAVAGRVFKIKLGEIARQLCNEARNKNILALGMMAGMLGMSLETVRALICEDANFGIVKKNLKVFESGFACIADGGDRDLPVLKMILPADMSARTIVSGNDMIVEGAMAAGCRASFGYPITPASEIFQDIAERLPGVRGASQQAEDEIAAIMKGIGASLTGSKTLIPTSGPGFSLMTESLGLAVGMEVPLVLVDVQRGGPSTGAPTKTEQSDLYHAIFGGHGDAPRIVLAPHDIESTYRLTVEAFNLSEYYQTPAIILTDQFLGQTPMALCGDFLNRSLPIIGRRKRAVTATGQYNRYENTSDGISPMADIGDPGGIYQTSGLSHEEGGSHDPSLKTQEWWHRKLARKLEPLTQRDDLVRVYGDPAAKDRIITWGSSAQAVRAAMTKLGFLDRMALCVPEIISPLPQRSAEFVENAERLLVIEMNASGQFFRYLRAMAYPPRTTRSCHRSGARPFSVGELAIAISDYFVSLEPEVSK